MDLSYFFREEERSRKLPPAEAQIAIKEIRARLADRLRDPENLRKELVGMIFEMHQNKVEWERCLKEEEVMKVLYPEREAYIMKMVLKYSALELQALCGLASLVAKPSCPAPDGGGDAEAS